MTPIQQFITSIIKSPPATIAVIVIAYLTHHTLDRVVGRRTGKADSPMVRRMEYGLFVVLVIVVLHLYYQQAMGTSALPHRWPNEPFVVLLLLIGVTFASMIVYSILKLLLPKE